MIKRLLQSAQNSQKHIYGSLNNKNLFYFASKKDLYDILGVSRNSTPDEIKKAYFIKAKKFHPDVNKESDAKEKFAEINNAYETLGDDKKKKVYDQTGFSGDDQMNQGFGEGGFDPFGGFGDFFKQGRGQSKTMEEEFFADFNEFFGDIGKQQTRQTKGSDIFVQIDLEFMEAVNGTKKIIQVEKKGLCTMCQGSKCKPGSAPSKCASCAGKGFMNYRQGPMTVQMVCSKCRGQGISIKNPCPQCQAQGIHMSKFQEEIQIPRGINHGQNIRMTGKGNYNDIGESPGDLILKVNLNQDKYFKRDNYDIYTKLYITISQAVLGHSMSIKTLDGEKEIHLQGGTQNGQQIKLEGKGISKLAPNQHQRGDHFVIVEVIIPKQLNHEQIALFQQLKLNEQKIDHFYQRIYLLQKAENKSQTQGQDKNNVFNKFKDFWK